VITILSAALQHTHTHEYNLPWGEVVMKRDQNLDEVMGTRLTSSLGSSISWYRDH
jgi:hypothetical protein